MIAFSTKGVTKMKSCRSEVVLKGMRASLEVLHRSGALMSSTSSRVHFANESQVKRGPNLGDQNNVQAPSLNSPGILRLARAVSIPCTITYNGILTKKDCYILMYSLFHLEQFPGSIFITISLLQC
jgi:hypothetical protein